MSEPAASVEALRFADGALWALDQTCLPREEHWLKLHDAGEVAQAIGRLAIRGAPLIGVAAAYGVALSAADDLPRACAALVAARPTAANLAYSVQRVQAAGPDRALAEARAIHAEEQSASAAMARHGADLLAGRARRVLTHCNTGALAAPGRGTALGVVAELHDRGELDHVIVCETRPLLQGARLTTWELQRLSVAHELIVDGAAAGLIANGEVDAVIVGCDRVAANGDVANKVGTLTHALAAADAGIPLVVVGPRSTIDAATPDGARIVIEQRDGEEVRVLAGLDGRVSVRNPAFDVTPARLITALVTERGVAQPVDTTTIAELLAGS